MDRAAYRAYVARWQRVNAFQDEELRQMSPETCLRQFFSLMNLGRAIGWETSTAAEVEQVRSRWRRLREAYLGKARC